MKLYGRNREHTSKTIEFWQTLTLQGCRIDFSLHFETKPNFPAFPMVEKSKMPENIKIKKLCF
jgi:hypothetical protein